MRYITLIFLFFYGLSFGQSALKTNLVSYWPCGTATTATDIPGTSDGTVGSTLTTGTGKIGNGYISDGQNNSKITLPDVAATQMYNKSFTWGAWLNISSYPSGNGGLFGGEDDAFTGAITSDGHIQLSRRNHSSAPMSTFTIPLNEWHYISFRYTLSGPSVTYGMDNTFSTSSCTQIFQSGAATNLFFQGYANVDKLVGMMDEIGLWSTVLSNALIDTLVNGIDGTGSEGYAYPFSTVEAPPIGGGSGDGAQVNINGRKHKININSRYFNYDIATGGVTPPYGGDDNFTGNIIYVDPISGNDANDGLTTTTSLRTLSHAQTHITNSTDYLALSDTVHSGAINVSNITRSSGDSLIITTWHKYGSGNATIDGETAVTGFTQNGNYWTKTVSGMPILFQKIFSSPYFYMESHLNGIRINGTYYGISRYPNGAHQYLSFETGSASPNTMIDYQMSAAYNYWNGGTIACQLNGAEWVLGKAHIDTYTGSGVFNVSMVNNEETRYDLSPSNVSGVKYYILNHQNAADQNGEWWQNHSTNVLGVYYTGNLNSQTVMVPLQDSCLNINNSSYIKVKKLNFKGCNKIQLRVMYSTGIDVERCNFYNSPAASIAFVFSTNVKANYNRLYDPSDNGIYSNSNSGVKFAGNYIRNAGSLGLFAGDENGIHMQGITTHYDAGNVLIEKNYIDGSGYNGIGIGTSTDNRPSSGISIMIRDNYIANSMQICSDGGGIYTFGYVWNNSKKIINNTVVSTYKNFAFTKPGTCIRDGAIYLDNPDRGWLVEGNTIFDYSEGYFPNVGTNRITLRNNVAAKNRNDCANLDYAFHVRSSSGGASDSTKYVRNKMVSGPLSENYNLWLSNSDGFNPYHNYIDSNDYYNPFEAVDYVWMTTTMSYSSAFRNLAWVQANTPWEDNATLNKTNWHFSDVTGITEDQFLQLFSNWSTSSHTFSLGTAVFKDLAGNSISGTLVLPAYSSKVVMYVSGSLSGLVTKYP